MKPDITDKNWVIDYLSKWIKKSTKFEVVKLELKEQ